MKCTTDLPAHIGSGSPWLQAFPALRNSYRKIHNGFNHFVFDGGFLVGDLRCQRIIQPDPSLQANFLNWEWTSKELFAAMRWGNVFGNRPWMVDCWRLWFFVCQHQPQCLSLRMKTKFGTIVTCKRPKALKCKLSTWAAGLQKCTNPFQPGERTESHHHWGAKSQNMILFDEPLFKTGWWCDQGPLIKSLVIGPLGWLFHERKSWRLHEWRFRSQGTLYEDGWCVDASFTWHWACTWITDTRIQAPQNAIQSMLLRMYPVNYN